MGTNIPPPSFHTFDPIKAVPENLFEAISSSMEGKHADLLEAIGSNQGIAELKEGMKPTLDKATLLLISTMDWQEDGGAPIPLERGHSREKLGRFPSRDGNAIEYLLEYIKVQNGESDLRNLLVKLGRGLSEDFLGLKGFAEGSGGLEILGWLNPGEVSELRNEIEGGDWSVMSSEPLDGGVQDALRHLLVFLRAAGRRKCGILMRRHS